MGFFDFLKAKEEVAPQKDEPIEVCSPINGTLIPLENVPDATFAQGLLGEGVGIDPSFSEYILAPISGVATRIFETGHAFTIETENGITVLVHFGLNTVELKGAGFEILAKEGDKVQKGDKIIKIDYEYLKEHSQSIVTPVIVLESDDPFKVEVLENTGLLAGNTVIMKITK